MLALILCPLFILLCTGTVVAIHRAWQLTDWHGVRQATRYASRHQHAEQRALREGTDNGEG